MSKIFLTSGFLGSGKTTFIKELIEYLSSKNIKVALIINEVGEIGIDNRYMKQLGYNVWEIFGGCICCTMASGLESTLKQLEVYNPDVIVIEPSGAADPGITINSLSNLGIDRKQISDFFIFDLTRLDMFLTVLGPLLFASIEKADFILINKLELVDEQVVKAAYEVLKEQNATCPVITIYESVYINPQLKEKIDNILRN
ncbi:MULTISPECIES: GTP-binding protein [unclassified Dehalobacter]|uniref:GTP-binding protein n=1 Tax=unclassified Dehalobacter TaxID=2635733 RepID=UPI00028B09F6|nr:MULTISPECIES: GTP-binding protein [unclassified Dehalobacter]AFV02188.1 cobalamin synthesis protein, P47K [Dehalobacter sp. DCA]AFV05233.1 cobalamin synthesis protein, P47K [Dehalobacter sp. CF]